jgi:hypothetical protein
MIYLASDLTAFNLLNKTVGSISSTEFIPLISEGFDGIQEVDEPHLCLSIFHGQLKSDVKVIAQEPAVLHAMKNLLAMQSILDENTWLELPEFSSIKAEPHVVLSEGDKVLCLMTRPSRSLSDSSDRWTLDEIQEMPKSWVLIEA